MSQPAAHPAAPHVTHSVSRLILLAFGLSVVMAVEMAAGQGFLKAMLVGQVPWPSVFMVLLMVAASTSAIVNAFTATMRPEPSRTAGTLGSCALAMVAGVEASQNVAPLPPLFYFGISLVGQATFAYCIAYVLCRNLKITGKWVTQPPFYAAGAILLFGAAGFVGQSFIALDAVTRRLPFVRDLALVAVPLVVLGACAFVRPLRLDPRSAAHSLRLRLPSAADGAPRRRMALLTTLGFGASFLVNLAVTAMGLPADPKTGVASLTVLNLGWLGLVVLSLMELAILTGEQRQGQVAAKLATHSAKRFLKRHAADKQAWAATVGLRTTNFHIDHDPGGFLHTRLPASIMQIRAEEIQRCVSDVLAAAHLHSHLVGHRIFGAVDPEASVRPCVDALKMFACLYLDAGPLVERRIKGLTALLPIVDPGLARHLKPTDISALIRRNLWFFHFDFGWIDQAVIHTPKATRYDVRIATLSSRIRQAMMTHLEKTGGVGNFVWLGTEARERLLQEAPALRHVVEACPIPTVAGVGEDEGELLMFIIKFEQLIPRLQRYFDLDSMRKSLLDFEPSQESARLLNLLSLQVAKARTEVETIEVLASLTSVPWRGFKEKDSALQLILAAYNSLSNMLTPGKALSESDDPKHRQLHGKVLEAVRIVGYPSQILHNAQISKIALRDNAALKVAASDARHPRFEEAWLLMATTDYARHGEERRRELLEFLSSVGGNGAVAGERLVQVKTIDALASLGRAAADAERAAVSSALAKCAACLTAARVDADVFSLLLDAHLFLAEHFRGALEVSADAQGVLEAYVDKLTTELGGSHPHAVGVSSRWQEMKTRGRGAAAASSSAA